MSIESDICVLYFLGKNMIAKRNLQCNLCKGVAIMHILRIMLIPLEFIFNVFLIILSDLMMIVMNFIVSIPNVKANGQSK